MQMSSFLRIVAKTSLAVIAITAWPQSLQMPKPVTPAPHAALIDEALRESSLTNGKHPFHLILQIHPGKVLFRGHEASSDMNGSMEVFWVNPTQYKLVLKSPAFSQTKIVDGQTVEEHDEGDFYPRWLDNFVKALFDPLPQADQFRTLSLPMYGGGTMQLPGRPEVKMPRCIQKRDRPGGITEETSQASLCFEASHDWIASGADFTRYVSFSDYKPFKGQ